MDDEKIMKLSFSGWPLPDEFLIELGRISVIWTALESLLNLCLGKLAGFNEITDPKPFILLAHTSFPQRLDMLGTLCELLEPDFPELSNYKQVISLLRDAQAKRNKFVHNGMHYEPDLAVVQMSVGSARGTLKVKTEMLKMADIRKTTMTIDEASASLYKLVLKRDIGPNWKRLAAKDQ